ncbi:hypothetical protein OAN96_00980 [Candidatus Gracilibacteria bacterium]|nr:hypothetical protein [Candidatus Gracilibacteria bacterium]
MTFKQAVAKFRNSKNARMGFIAALILIVLALLIFWGKAKAVLWAIVVVLAIALAVEGFDYDVDLGKLMETGSYEQSRVETIKDSDGNSVRMITGNCNSKEFDLNCKDFSTQTEAQAKYNACAEEIASNNPGIDVKKFDIYGLDGNKNGIVCEALPKGA